MKKGKYSNGRVRKPVALLLALVLVLGVVIGGTIAWLTDTTGEVKNTFTTSDVDIDLKETKTDFQMVPGCTIEKDPIVTVLKESEDAWVFVKVDESANLDNFITYEVDTNNWKPLEGVEGVYYTKYESRDDVDISIKVLKDNKVTVKDTVTKGDMDALTAETYPKLSFTAYACQYMKNNDEAFKPIDAWNNVYKPATP